MQKLFFIILLGGVTTALYGQTWKFIIYGDNRSHDSIHRTVLNSIAENTPNYKFIVNVGDVVLDGTVTSQWQSWQSACDDELGGTGQDQLPPKYMAVPGNHDNTGQAAGLINWNTYLPGQKNLYGNEGRFFVFDYEDARFILLDSNISSNTGDQYTMLMDTIRNNPRKWLFAVWHHPIFDFDAKVYMGDLHNDWGVPLYDRGCDIIFNGHAHYYVRSKKLQLDGEKNPPLDQQYGTAQIVTGNGGATLVIPDPNNDNNGYLVANYITNTDQFGYTELTVSPDTLYLRHILSNGSILDSAKYTPNSEKFTSITNFESDAIPVQLELKQNYPNPFNPNTKIDYRLKGAGYVQLKIYNSKGERIITLIDEYQNRGQYTVDFEAKNLASGVYFYQLQIGNSSVARRMILMR